MTRSHWRTIVVFAAATFVLHWAWETAHAVAYVQTDLSFGARVVHCLPMALVDTVWSGAIVLMAVGAARLLGAPSLLWGVAAAVGALGAVGLEWYALASGGWSYNERMPIVPLVNVGLWPVLQMTLLPSVAAWLAVSLAARRSVARQIS